MNIGDDAPQAVLEAYPELPNLVCIGKGGIGTVYAQDDVAVKLYAKPVTQEDGTTALQGTPKCEDYIRWATEYRSLFDGDGLVKVLDVRETSLAPSVAMEFKRGGDLESYLHRGRMGLMMIEGIFRNIYRGLGKLHAERLICRDLDATNIMSDGTIIDPDVVIKAEEARTIIGKYCNLSPEEFVDRISLEADVYRAAAVLHHMITKRTPAQAALDDLERARREKHQQLPTATDNRNYDTEEPTYVPETCMEKRLWLDTAFALKRGVPEIEDGYVAATDELNRLLAPRLHAGPKGTIHELFRDFQKWLETEQKARTGKGDNYFVRP